VIVALAGQKGGTGKSTIATNLAATYHRRRQRTLLVDGDPQRSSLTWSARAGELDHDAPPVVGMGADMARKGQLPRLAAEYDRVVIDCPPSNGPVPRAAMRVADLVIVPWRPGPTDAWSLAETLDLAADEEVATVIAITQCDHRTALGRGARDQLADIGVHVMTSALRLRVAYPEAMASGQEVATYAPRGAAAKEFKAFAAEVERLLKGLRDG